MKRALKVVRMIALASSPFFLALSFLPVFNGPEGALLGIDVIYGRGGYGFSLVLFVSYLLPVLASLLLLLHKKLKSVELISAILFVLAGVLISMSPGLDVSLAELPLSLHPLPIIEAVHIFILALLLFLFLSSESAFSVYEIVEAAMLIALAVGLDLPGLKIQLGANGGSIGFTMVPLLVLALTEGPLKGFLGAGVIYGLITCLLDGWGLYTYPFDYLLGYGSIALFGFFSPLILGSGQTKYNAKGALFIVTGTAAAILARLLMASLSGVIFYEFTFPASLAYNALYILPDGALCAAVLLLLYRPLIDVKRFILARGKKAETP